jgi:MFS family permease
LLSILLVIFAFTFVDRSALNLLLQDIKVDLNLSDTQLGLLTGIAFSGFYAVLGIPIARWADNSNRVVIISVALGLESIALGLCGVAAGFLQLLLIRVFVAVGESGCVPAANSLIATHFSRAERPRATAIYMLGSPLSAIIGSLLAGWLNQIYGWRVTFMLLALPGLALAPLVWFTLREPRQIKRNKALLNTSATVLEANSETAASLARPTLREVGASLWANITFRHLLFGFSIMYFFNTGIWKWQPAFLIRSHGLTTGEMGTWLAVIYGAGGFLGTYLGGEMASRYAPHNESLQLKAIAVLYGCFGIISAGMYLAPNKYWAFGLMGIATVGIYATNGPLLATIQTLVPDNMRATALAIIYLFANLIGLGLGPLTVGALSDALRPLLGSESLRYALLIMCPGYLWVTWHLWRASRTVKRDIERDPYAKSSHRTGGRLVGTISSAN